MRAHTVFVIELCLMTTCAGFIVPFQTSLTWRRSKHGRGLAKNDIPGSDLFPEKGSSYVPSGLTPEEYSKIKRDEKAAEERMNYGQWGPRFSVATRPDGDWFVMPSLWTGGYDSNGETKNSTIGLGAWTALRNRTRETNVVIQAFVLAYVFLDCVTSAIAMWAASRTTLKLTFWLGMKSLLWTRRIQTPTAIFAHLAKLVSAAVLALPGREVLENLNRKWLWSQARAFLTLLVSFVVCLGGWAAILICFRATLQA